MSGSDFNCSRMVSSITSFRWPTSCGIVTPAFGDGSPLLCAPMQLLSSSGIAIIAAVRTSSMYWNLTRGIRIDATCSTYGRKPSCSSSAYVWSMLHAVAFSSSADVRIVIRLWPWPRMLTVTTPRPVVLVVVGGLVGVGHLELGVDLRGLEERRDHEGEVRLEVGAEALADPRRRLEEEGDLRVVGVEVALLRLDQAVHHLRMWGCGKVRSGV